MSSKTNTNRNVMLLALLAAGCGERFQLGEVGQGLDGDESANLDLPLLADDLGDADVTIQSRRIGEGIGDVDGDGYDDWMTYMADGQRGVISYGGPRPTDGVLSQPDQAPSFVLHDGEEEMHIEFGKAGDVNSDGYDDLVFWPRFVGDNQPYDVPDDEADYLAQRTETAIRRWAEQRAFLWYGRPQRPEGAQELDVVAIPFHSRGGFLDRLLAELAEEARPEEGEYTAGQRVMLTPLGDMDGDGHDDLAWTVYFNFSTYRENDPQRLRQSTGAVTYVLYGSAEQLASDAEPAARLEGVRDLRGIGDVNGDGFADVRAIGEGVTRLLAGGAERPFGELTIDEIGVPMTSALEAPWAFANGPIGDVDSDGYDDLFVPWETEDSSTRLYLVYGSPTLLSSSLTKNAASAMFSVHGPIAGFSPGDWDADGHTDILLNHSRLVTDQYGPIAGIEARLIPGGPERYSGTHEVSVFRPEAATDDVANVSWASIPGDIDGDGFADAFILGHPYVEPTAFVKYGRPLTAPIY